MSKFRGFRYFCGALVGLIALQAVLAVPALAQDGCIGGDRVREVTQWGNPATTFSPTPVRDLGALKDAFSRYEADLRAVLAQVGWPGDPDDFFATVRGAQEGDPAVTVKSVPTGAEFEWMAFRRRGKPACVKRISWQGRKPFQAWNVVVASGDFEYTFVIPQECLNVAMVAGAVPRALPPPTCQLSASFDADSDLITVKGKTDGTSLKLSSAKGPGGFGLANLKSGGAMTWTGSPLADGRHEFGAVATGARGRESTCSAAVDVVRKKPVLVLTATPDQATKIITLDSTGSVGDVSITGITLPDGSAGDLSDLVPTDNPGKRWTYDAGPTLPMKPGGYTYTFSGVAKLHGSEVAGEASAVVERESRGGRFILRGYGAKIDAKGDSVHTVRTLPPGPFAGLEERTQTGITDGEGFGLSLEYLVRPRIGIDFEVLVSDLESDFMVDIGQIWVMEDKDLGFNLFAVGINFHLTPDKRVDVFLGPLFGRAQFDDLTFSFSDIPGITYRRDFEDDSVFGAKIGFDYPFGWQNPWALTGGLRYLLLSAEASEQIEIDVDPFIFTLGLSYRF